MLNIDSVGNITFNLAALIVSITCIFYTLMMRQRKSDQNRMYLYMIIIVMVDAITDIGCEVVSVVPISGAIKMVLYHIFHFTYFLTHFSIAPLLAIYVLMFCGVSFRFTSRVRFYLSVPYYLMEALVVLNPLLGQVYTVDDNLIFHRGVGVYIAYGISIFYVLFSMVALVMYWNILNRLKKFAITYFFFIVIVGTLIQMFFIEIRCELMCEAIGLTGLMIIMENNDDWNDASTGTFNRVAFLRNSKIYFKYNRKYYSICIRLQNASLYRKITDLEGYETILLNIAMFLNSFNPKYEVYRVSNDCFFLICPDIDEDEASYISEKIFDRFSKEWIYDNGSFLLRAVIYEVLVPDQISNLDYLLLLSDSSIDNDYDRAYYKIEDLDFVFRRAALEKSLAQGLENRKFEVCYSPIYTRNGYSICGAESILKFYDDELGLVEPDEFVPIARETGIISSLGWFNIEEVFYFLGGGITEEMGLEFVSINLSSRQVIESDFARQVINLLDKYRVDARRVVFNLSESSAAANRNVINKTIDDLAKIGIRFYMANYGSDLFSMRAVLPSVFEGARINAHLISNAGMESDNRIIIENRINIINQMNKKLLIDGVDDLEALAFIDSIDSDYIQGEYFSAATTKNEFISILRATELARMEERRAKAASEAKSSFLANMSHEIRTPINAVLGMNEVILRECKDESILEYARNIEGAGRTLLSLINDILDFSKIESGSMEVSENDYELFSLLNDVYNMVNIRAEKKDLKLNFDIDENLPVMLYGDEMRIRQVMVNLLNNSVKYTNEGSVTLALKGITTDDNSLDLEIKAIDTGIGIKESDMDTLFDTFKRLEIDKNKTVEGSGLGLAITKSLIELMNGTITVDSIYGVGSTFTATIPQGIRSDIKLGNFNLKMQKKSASTTVYKEKFTAPEAEILVVDDTPMNHTVIRELLKHTLVHIDSAKSGMEALELVHNKKYDIIFLDYRMPQMNGVETLGHIKEDMDGPNINTPVVVLTANAIYGAKEAFLKEGFDNYLSKPIDSDRLESTIMEYLPADKLNITMVDEDDNLSEESKDIPPWVDGLSIIDSTEGLKNCGSYDSYLSIIKVYYQSIAGNRNNILTTFEDGNYKDYTSFVHSLKSTSRTIGAMGLSNLAKELEDAGNNGDIDFIKQNTPTLLDMYLSVENELGNISEIAGNDNVSEESKPTIDDDMLLDAYNTILDTCQTMDYDTLSFVVKSVNEYSISDDDNAIMKSIDELAYRLDWEEIKSIVAKRLNKES